MQHAYHALGVTVGCRESDASQECNHQQWSIDEFPLGSHTFLLIHAGKNQRVIYSITQITSFMYNSNS